MQEKQWSGKEFIEDWVSQRMQMGKTIDEMHGTTFVYGNEMLTLKKGTERVFEFEPKEVPRIVVLHKNDELELGNTCCTCGMEHHSFKAVLECCADVD